MGNCFTTTRSNSVHVSTSIHCICSHTCVGRAVHRPADYTTLPPLSLSYHLNTSPLEQTPGAQPRVSSKCQLLELSSTALSLVHNIDAGLSVKTASKAPLYAGADAGIEISSIPASSASSVNVERQYCEPGLTCRPDHVTVPALYRDCPDRLFSNRSSTAIGF